MHELSIAQGAIEMAEQAAAGRRITRITLEVGELAGVTIESLSFCFDLAAEGTLAEGATLQIYKVEGLAQCELCKRRFRADSPLMICECGSSVIRIVQGEELNLKCIELGS
ncbi:MAG TPA: hydrogenase maturation nickel metallochaperone HypA [Methylocystis sp.]|nr:hydrogenase maturation nickel metallochaperone HypA [Methylocystis sp.]